jgi:hypothetical protein
LTNREVAARLFLSPKTIETHCRTSSEDGRANPRRARASVRGFTGRSRRPVVAPLRLPSASRATGRRYEMALTTCAVGRAHGRSPLWQAREGGDPPWSCLTEGTMYAVHHSVPCGSDQGARDGGGLQSPASLRTS